MRKYALLLLVLGPSSLILGVPHAALDGQQGGSQNSNVTSSSTSAQVQKAALEQGLASTSEPTPWLMRFAGSIPLSDVTNGEPVTMFFAVYDDQKWGAALWSEVQVVAVNEGGDYSVLLGAKTPGGLPTEVFSTTEPRWLGVRVGNHEESPRVLLVSVPYAFRAMEADRLAGHSASDFVTTDALQSAVQQQLQQKPAGVNLAATANSVSTSGGPPSVTTDPATKFVDSTTDQVVLVQQEGIGMGLSANAISNVAVLGTVQASAKPGSVAGVEGVSSLNNSYGLLGYNIAASGGIGVHARSDSPDGIGLQAWAAGTGGIAVNATSSASSGNPISVVARVLAPNATGVLITNVASGTVTGPLLTAKTNSGTQFTVGGNGSVSAAGSILSGSTVSGTQVISAVATGTPPLQVASTTQVPNLNASLLGGNSASYFAPATGSANYIQNGSSQQVGTSFNVSGNGTVGGALNASAVNASVLNVAGPLNISGAGNGLTFADGTVQQTASRVTLNSNVFTGQQEAPALLADTSVTIGSNPGTNGQSAIIPDSLDTVHSWIGQAGSQMHFRLSRADNLAPKDFLITPYKYGTAIEYPGVIEVWSSAFSVHMNHSLGGNSAAYFWVGDESDLGGLFATAHLPSGAGPNGNIVIAADKFDHTSHGKMYFTVRNPDDAFLFNWGPYQQESVYASIRQVNSGQQNSTNIESYSGPVTGAMITDSANQAVRFGSRSVHPVQIFSGDGWGKLIVYPSGNVAIGQGGDVARLAVGDSSQFQVSSAGAVTIGSGTPITMHLSATGSVTLADFNANSCNTVSLPVVGASDGDTVALGVPSVLSSIDGLTWFGFISAQDTAGIRVCNVTTAAITNVPQGTVRVDVWKH